MNKVEDNWLLATARQVHKGLRSQHTRQRAAGSCLTLLRGSPAQRVFVEPCNVVCPGAAWREQPSARASSDNWGCRLVLVQYLGGCTESHSGDGAHARVFNRRVRCSMKGVMVVSDANQERADFAERPVAGR
jgi:hypothetical protein